MWPHRAEVVADRVVPALAFRHGADAPTGEELVTHQVLYTASSFVLVGDSAPEQVADVRSHRVHLPAVAVDGEREAAPGLEPIVSVEPRLQLRGGPVQPDGELGIVPDLPGEASAPDLGVVHVTLDLTCRPGQLGVRAVREKDGVPRVLPALVLQAGLHALLVVDVAVAVVIPIRIDPGQRRPCLELEVADDLVVAGPGRVLVQENQEERRRVGGSVVGRLRPFLESRQLEDLARLFVSKVVDARALPGGQRTQRCFG